jgi:hypothetical protein
MYLLLTDESNLRQTERVKFFTYGGLIIHSSNLPALHEAIKSIREEHKYRPTDKLKFDSNSRPEHISTDEFAIIKRKVITECIRCDCKFIAYVVLHNIARNAPIEQTIQWGADHVIGKFNFFLQCNNSHGMVAIDRLPNGVEFDYLSRKFTAGLTFQGEDPVILNKIVLFSSTCINASHANSAMDIVLGSWRYCINQPFNLQAAKTMMGDLAKLLWCERDGEYLYAFEKGLIFRPQNIRQDDYRVEYDALLTHINVLLREL